MSSSHRPDSAETLLVLAKEPVPGRVKTRLHARFSAGEAAGLAACAIEDTLAAVRASRATRKVLVWDGDPYPWNLEFDSVPQAGGTLNDRLEAAFQGHLGERVGLGAADRHGHPAGHRGAAGHRLGGRRRGARAERGRRLLGDRTPVG